MNPVDDGAPPPSRQQPPPASSGNGGGIMVFYPCATDDLTSDPRTNQLIMRAISQAGANLSRDSPTAPAGFALMVPNTNMDVDPIDADYDPLEHHPMGMNCFETFL